MKLTFANKITICRILAVPFFIAFTFYYSPDRDYIRWIVLGIFLFAVISDVIDGYIARTRNQKTPAGAMLDPLADKLLLMSAFLCLYKMGPQLPVVRFPIWLVIAVISKDVILLIGAAMIYIQHGRLTVEVTRWGKLSTFFQVVTIISMLILHPWKILWYTTLVFTIISGIDYLRHGIKVMNLPAPAMDKREREGISA